MLLPNAMILILQFNILLLLSFCGIQIMLSDLTDFKKLVDIKLEFAVAYVTVR